MDTKWKSGMKFYRRKLDFLLEVKNYATTQNLQYNFQTLHYITLKDDGILIYLSGLRCEILDTSIQLC